MNCPVCHKESAPAAVADVHPTDVAGPVAICGACGFACFVEADGTVRRATFEDVKDLSPDQMDTLKKAAGLLRRRRQ